MDDKFIVLLYKNVNQSIDRLNDFNKDSNESTFDATISYLLHEIEYLKLLISENKIKD